MADRAALTAWNSHTRTFADVSLSDSVDSFKQYTRMTLFYSVFDDAVLCNTCWLRSTVVERRYFAGELPCPALDLQLSGDHLCG